MAKKLCGNCFSPMRGRVCSKCGFTERRSAVEYDALPVGTRLCGRYTIGRVLGRGGFGIIYLAYDERDEKTVAVKEFYPDETAVRVQDDLTVEPMTSQHNTAYSDGLARFINEAEIITRFRESSEILGIYDFFKANGTAYYAMEFVKGISLKKYVDINGAVTEGQAVFIAERILPALAVIHAADTLHRDVCPDNIMLCANGAVRLIDFGSARVISDSSQSMSVILKPGFAPLEQYQRKGKQGGWTDIYSLGASLYFGLTGEAPEDPLTRLDTDDIFPKKLKTLSPEFSKIIERSAAVKAENRYRKAEDMLYDIKSCGIEPCGFSADKIYSDGDPRGDVKPPLKRNTVSPAAKLLRILRPIEVRIGGKMYSVETTELDLSGMELTNAQAQNLRHLKKLRRLDLNDNYLTDLSYLDRLHELEELYFNNNNISDISFTRSMMKLKSISGENSTVKDISVLADKTELISVFFGDSRVSDITPLKNCRRLRMIGFNEMPIGSLEPFRGMTELEMVCLAGCGLSDISPLRDSKKLRFVYLGRNKLSDLSPLSGCVIEELYIDNNRLSGHTDTMKGITLSGFAAIDGNGFTESEIENIRNTVSGSFKLFNGYTSRDN